MLRALASLLILFVFSFPAMAEEEKRSVGVDGSPRVVALLQQGLAAERGIGIARNSTLAMALYHDAAWMGSAEAHYRIGRILKRQNPSKANSYFALAARLGHREAARHHNPRMPKAILGATRSSDRHSYDQVWMEVGSFDLQAYVANLAGYKRNIAGMIRSMAPQFGVDTSFALGIALAESNLEPRAVSPKNAQGVMQLIPATQDRFGIKNAFDPKQNIRGGLTYLRWLQQRYAGDRVLVAAAYNAGEGAVDKYRGVPPFAETQHYVRRVMYFSGLGAKKKKPEKKATEKTQPEKVPPENRA